MTKQTTIFRNIANVPKSYASYCWHMHSFGKPTTCYTADGQFTPCVSVRKQRGAVDCRHVVCMHMIPTAVHIATVTVTASQFVINGPLVAGVQSETVIRSEMFPVSYAGQQTFPI